MPGRHQRIWISPIVRPKTGGVALGDALEMGETAEGRFASLFWDARFQFTRQIVQLSTVAKAPQAA